jgi:hypothetical protein
VGAVTADDVGRAFRIARQFTGSPCHECGKRETVGVVYLGVVSASCDACGGSTRKGVITPELLRDAEVAEQGLSRPRRSASPTPSL